MAVRISGFADETAAALEDQARIFAELGIRYIDFRQAWGKNAMNLNEAEVDRAVAVLADTGRRVSCIGSPIGKYPIADPIEPELERLEKAIALCRRFGCSMIRIFSYYPPEGANPWEYAEPVVKRLRALAARAGDAGVTLMLENEKGIFGDTGERVAFVLDQIDAPALQHAFDPANYVQVGLAPLGDCWPLVKHRVGLFHVKDAVKSDGTIRVPGEGDGQFPGLLREARAAGYDGFFALEPHLQAAHHSTGETTPELYGVARHALLKMLAGAGFQVDPDSIAPAGRSTGV